MIRKGSSLSNTLLAQPWAYLLFQYMVGPHARKYFLRDFVHPEDGQKVLDIGCGPGLLCGELKRMADVCYTGVDVDPKYVANARARYGDKFRVGDIVAQRASDYERYDRIVAYGLLHHLSDEQANAFFKFAASVLKPGGKVVTLDGTLVAQQNRIARVIIALDRGQMIRAPEHYRYLAQPYFAELDLQVRHDLQRIPYSCAIVTAKEPVEQASA